MQISAVNFAPALRPLEVRPNNEVERGISIRPDENNVDSGDRSQNSFDVTINTKNISAEFSVTREQTVEAIIRRNTRNNIADLYSGGSNLLTAKLALNAGLISEEQVLSLATSRYNQKQLSTYLSIYSNNQVYGQVGNGYPAASAPTGYEIYTEANQKEIRRTLFFSALDNQVIDIKI